MTLIEIIQQFGLLPCSDPIEFEIAADYAAEQGLEIESSILREQEDWLGGNSNKGHGDGGGYGGGDGDGYGDGYGGSYV